ncbi:MAG: metallophosphoesterase family protein [Thermoguttaceae bacterium]
MTGRTIAIGDIHGCKAALCALLEAIAPAPDDTIVTLGDYVDRGPDSRGVMDTLIALADRCRLVPLLGNHDEMLLEICNGQAGLYDEWLLFGGNATVDSYDGRVPEAVPPEHLDFLRGCRSFYESDRHIFLHGSYLADVPMEQQPPDVLRWDSVKPREPGAHCSGKTVIVGHTAQRDGEILDLGYLLCIDTCCYGDGWLTALEVNTGQTWQADKTGRLRE